MIRFSQLFVLLLFPIAVQAQFPANWTEPAEPIQIADNLYYVGSAGLAAFLFTSDEGHILLDAPMEENVPMILANIRKAGFDPADIKIHLASHAHFDHVGGFAGLIEATGGELWMSEWDAPYVAAGNDFGLDTKGYPPATPDRTFGNNEVVQVGDLKLTPLVTPGHTPGCTTWTGEVTIEGKPHSFLAFCSLTILPMYTLSGDEATHPDLPDMFCRSAMKLRAQKPDIFLANHPFWFDMEEKRAAREAGDAKAFVDPEGYQTFIQQVSGDIDRILTERGFEGGCTSIIE